MWTSFSPHSRRSNSIFDSVPVASFAAYPWHLGMMMEPLVVESKKEMEGVSRRLELGDRPSSSRYSNIERSLLPASTQKPYCAAVWTMPARCLRIPPTMSTKLHRQSSPPSFFPFLPTWI